MLHYLPILQVGKSIAYNFKLRMTEKSSQMDGWILQPNGYHQSTVWSIYQTFSSFSGWD